MLPRLILACSVVLTLPAAAAERPAPRPRLCPQDAPPGVRLPDRPGCREAPPVRRGGTPGFIDLGDGTQVRISGRASVEVGYRR